MGDDSDAEAEGEAPGKLGPGVLILTLPFAGIQIPVAAWEGEEYPFFWPGQIHEASELEAELSDWRRLARYFKAGSSFIETPFPFP